jgi:thiol-disulfide isomerase/thioredoxin
LSLCDHQEVRYKGDYSDSERMIMKRSHILLSGVVLLSLLLLISPGTVEAQTTPAGEDSVIVYFYWGDGCPHCAAQKPFMEYLAGEYPQIEVRSYEVWYVPENLDKFFAMAAAAGFEPQAVPTTFIGEKVWAGFREDMKAEMEAQVAACLQSGCPDPGRVLAGAEAEQPAPPTAPAPPAGVEEALLTLPVIGTINLNAQSLPFSTAIIALVTALTPVPCGSCLFCWRW